MRLHTIAQSLLLGSLLTAAGAGATLLPISSVTSIVSTALQTTSGFAGVAVDESTGKIYQRKGYNGEDAVLVYANAAAFAAKTPASTLTLAGGGFFGTYFEVSNGKLFGRSSSSGTAVSRWDVGTGVRELTRAAFSGMGGENFTDTFNWGGFSGVNFMQDQTGLYVFGHSAGTSLWQLNKVDANLNVLSSLSANLGSSLGYAFLMNGTLFASTSYSSNQITKSLNLSTGAVSNVDFALSGSSSPYYDNVSYDYATDTLMAHTESGSFLQASKASIQLGVPLLPAIALPTGGSSGGSASAVPVPATLALVVLGLGLLAGVRRRLR